MTERQILGDAINVGFVNDGALAEAAEALGVFGLRQVAATGAGAQDFAGGGDLEPFGYGLLRFDAFGTSHKFISIAKGRALYDLRPQLQACFFDNCVAYGALVLRLRGKPAPAPAFTSIGAPALSWVKTAGVMSTSGLT